MSDVNSVIVAGRYQARPRGRGREWEHDYDPAQDEVEEDGDEEFFDTIKSKKKKAGLARAESAKRMAEVGKRKFSIKLKFSAMCIRLHEFGQALKHQSNSHSRGGE